MIKEQLDSCSFYTNIDRGEDIVDIRDKIRETFSKKKVVNEETKKKVNSLKRFNPSKWDSDTQPNIYELDNFLRKSGYKLVDIIEHEDNIPELIIEPLKKGYLHPEINHDVNEKDFYVNVIKYGMLELSDLEGIIEGYETALGVLRHLKSVSLDTLEIGEDEE